MVSDVGHLLNGLAGMCRVKIAHGDRQSNNSTKSAPAGLGRRKHRGAACACRYVSDMKIVLQ